MLPGLKENIKQTNKCTPSNSNYVHIQLEKYNYWENLTFLVQKKEKKVIYFKFNISTHSD